MKKLLVVLLLCLGSAAFGQNNLVLNGDFESYSYCPTGFDQIRAADYWFSLDTNAFGGIPGIAEYYNTCTNDVMPQYGIPQNGLYFYQNPSSGNGLAQVLAFFDSTIKQPETYYRDYLQGRLYKKLTAGRSYCVTFYTNLTEISQYAIKELGIYLDDGKIDTAKSIALPQTQYIPQLVNTAGFLTDTAHWLKIEGSFIANGTEQFITIGNFRDKAHTTFARVPSNRYNGGGVNYGWYLIDDVSVVESNAKADAGPDKHVGAGDSIFIGYHDMALDAYWTILGDTTVIGKGAGMWVKPATTTSYVITQTICGYTTKDTVKVEVWKAGISSINGQSQSYFLAPNPSVDRTISIHQSIADSQPVQLIICNTMGAIVHSSFETFKDKQATLHLGSLPKGFYYLRLKDAKANTSFLKLVLE